MSHSTTGGASRHDLSRRAGWVHHPQLDVLGPLDQTLQVPVPGGLSPLMLHLVFTEDGLYLPAVSRQPDGAGPFATIIAIHGGSGGLGVPFLVDHMLNQGWALDAMLARGYAVVLAEGRCELEDAYGTAYPGVLDHDDMIAVYQAIARQPWADARRIGFFGVSHGGEMQMKLAAELGRQGEPMPAALTMCEPAIIEFLGLRYDGVRKEANLQFQAPIADGQIDLARAMERIARIPSTLPMLVVGRDEDHLQGPFMKLHELLQRAGKRSEWATYSYPEHAYQLGPRRNGEGYAPHPVQAATLARVLDFLDRHVRDHT